MVMAGLSNDLLFSECQTLVVTAINILMIVWNFWDIVYPAHNNEVISWTLSLFGMSSGFSDMFITVLLPMTIADKNRVLAYELTMLGTIFALVHFTFFCSTSLIGGLVVEIMRKNINFGNIPNRIVVIVLISLSTWIFWSKSRT